MIKSQEYVTKIISLLAVLCLEIRFNNKNGCYDINKYSENLMKSLFNKVYGYKLENINIIETLNYPAIDLGDKKNQIAIQVTADSSNVKIKHTIKQFIKSKLYKRYKKLRIILLTNKIFYKAEFDTRGKFIFDKDSDVIEMSEIIKDISDMKLRKIRQIKEFLESELGAHSNNWGLQNKAEDSYFVMTSQIEKKIISNKLIYDEELDLFNVLSKKYFNQKGVKGHVKKLRKINELIRCYNKFPRKPGQGDKIREFVKESHLIEVLAEFSNGVNGE